MTQPTFYWHDYETWGTDPARDRPCQFAGQRTDSELNPIGEPLVIFARPTPDLLPHPEACLVTGITPQRALAEGLPECEFIRQIHEELSRPGTCGAGYNSIRFDDEVTRYALYRNFFDPYAREWQGGNSRWDLIDVVRLCCALRPENIEWPLREDGTPTFRLEELTRANGLAHESAHDALSDVRATIALARLLKREKPKLFDYALGLRRKQEVARLLDLSRQKPLLHISSRYPASRFCSALVMPLAFHPVNRNSVIAYDLMCDPEPLLELDAAAVAQRVFTASEALPDGVERIPLKEIHLNRSPMLVTAKSVDEAAAARLQIDLDQCQRNWRKLHASAEMLRRKLDDIYGARVFAEPTDPEVMLYSGGFFGDEDRALIAQVRGASADELSAQTYPFTDARLPELLFRYRARNFPDSLSADERAHWVEFCRERLTKAEAGGSIVLDQYRERIEALRAALAPGVGGERQRALLAELEAYGDQVLDLG